MRNVDIDRFVLPRLLGIKPYEAAEPLVAMAEKAGVPADRIIRLNANENPYGASPKVAEALASLPTHIYPDPLQRNIRGEVGKYTGIDPAYIVCGAGSDELIDLLFRLVVSPGTMVIQCDPTFGMYSFYSGIAGAEIRSVPRDAAFEVDVPAVKNAIDPATKMVFLNSPNNPTGNPLTTEQLGALMETGPIVVVDEAYYEFCGETVAGLVLEHENLVVLRTFSKWAGIAGLRVGYGIMSPRLVKRIIDIKPPFNINAAGEAALLASLEDADALLGNVKLIVDERERIFSLLEELPGVKPWPSGGNYILCEFGPGRATLMYEGLIKRGIFVRKFSHERLADFFRITVGTPEQTDAVIAAMSDLA